MFKIGDIVARKTSTKDSNIEGVVEGTFSEVDAATKFHVEKTYYTVRWFKSQTTSDIQERFLKRLTD